MKMHLQMALLAGFIALTPAAKAATTLVFNNFVPQSSVYYKKGIEAFKETVEKGTNGRVRIEITPATLAPPDGQLEMVQSGIADLAIFSPTFLRNKISLPNVATLPGSGKKSEPGSVALWRTHEKYLAKAGEWEGVKLLGLMRFDAKVLFTSSRQVKSLRDLHGLKVQAVPGAGPEVLSILGATPVPYAQVQAHELLSSGVIDGTFTEYDAVVGFNMADKVKHIVEFPEGLASSVLSLIMSEDSFNALSPEDQKVILGAGGEAWARSLGGALDEGSRILRERMVEEGKTLLEAGPEFSDPVRPALNELKAKWIETAAGRGVDGEAAIEYYLDQYRQVDAE